MSLRRRFVLVTLLAVVTLGAAAIVMFKVLADSSAGREREALARSDTTVQALARKLKTNEWKPSLGPEVLAEQRAFVVSLLAPLSDASAGVCDERGVLGLLETVAPTVFDPVPPREGPPGFPHEHGPDHLGPDHPQGLFPLDRDVLIRACKAKAENGITHVRFAAPHDLIFISLLSVSSSEKAFALVRIPNRARDPGSLLWQGSVFVLGFVTILLVLLLLDTLRVLSRGSQGLRRALVDLQKDLHADIPIPRAAELSQIALGLKEMAHNLAASRDRERDLARRIGHEQRLIGLGRVVAGVAHEVRNPLTGMKLKLDVMARRQLDAKSARDIAICLNEIERLDRVVRSLLLVARRGPLEKEWLDLEQLVDERLVSASALMDECGVRASRVGTARITANREDLARVIDNLLRNAIEASPAGAEVTITIVEAAGLVHLTFIDRGEGVPASRVAELFEPFFTCKPEGTGLGLVLSRAIVEAHEGQLQYHRDEDQTRFVASIPVSSAHVA